MTVDFTCGSAGKESACNARDLGLIHGLRRSLEKGKVTHSSLLAWRIPWIHRTSLVAQTVKCLPTMRETWVQSLGREDPLEKEMATHSCLENPMDGPLVGYTVHGVTKSQTQLSDTRSLIGLQRVRHH